MAWEVGQRPLHSIVCLPLPGMPDPKDSTKRIPRPASKVNDCWHIALEAYESNPIPQAMKPFCLERRAQVIAFEGELCKMWKMVPYEKYAALYKRVTLQDARSGRFDEDFIRVRKSCAKCDPKFEGELQSFIEQMQFQNLLDFALWRTTDSKAKIEERFLAQIGINPELLYTQILASYHSVNIKLAHAPLRELSPQKRYTFLSIWVNRIVAEGCGLKISSWDPMQPIENLIDEINKHGFLLVGGTFGPRFYSRNAIFESHRIKDRLSYAFRDNGRMNISVAHVIRIVCAQVLPDTSEQVVFFQDPCDASDLTGSRIYNMDYGSLIGDILDLNGVKQRSLKSAGFAYYGNPVKEEEGKRC